MDQEPIYHITRGYDWVDAGRRGRYVPDSLSREGFIHFSAREQVIDTAHRFYHGRRDLVILVVDPRAVEADLRWEEAPDGAGTFPHLYGPLELSAVTEVLPFPCGPDGTFPSPFQR